MDHKRAEEVAVNRLQIISPMLDPALDKAKKQDFKEKASIQYGISERTIRRWISIYTEKSFEGLKPKAPETSGTSKIPEDCLFFPPELSELLSRMEFVSERHLFAVLTDDCGTGKTTILRKLSSRLDPRKYRMLYVSDSRLPPHSFYRAVLEQPGIIADWNRSKAKRQLHEQLSIMQAVDGISTVCVVDESHLLSFEMLEEIRFLMNMKFDSVSPIALILSGQTELWKNRLSLQKCEAIRQRIYIQSVLNHYDRSRTGDYIRHQLEKNTMVL